MMLVMLKCGKKKKNPKAYVFDRYKVFHARDGHGITDLHNRTEHRFGDTRPWLFTELANKWDANRAKTEGILHDYVSRNPGQFAIIVATSVHTSMALGSGIVDLLRLGDGLSKGTWSGVGEDGLRVVGVAAPAAKGLQMYKSFANTKLAKLIVDIGGPRCSWINSAKALAHTGHKTTSGKLFASVQDLLSDMHVNIDSSLAISLNKMVNRLRSIGARAGSVVDVNSVAQVLRYLKSDGNVVLVSLNGMLNGARTGGHAVYFFRDTLGRVRIMDRTDIYKSLDELVAKYGQFDKFIPRAIAPLENIYAKYVAPQGTTLLAIEVIGVSNVNPDAESDER